MSEDVKRYELVGEYDLTICEMEDGDYVAYSDHQAKVEALEQDLSDIKETYSRIINEKCAKDEKHCTCVPALREELKRYKDNMEWLEERKYRTRVKYNPYLQSCRWLVYAIDEDLHISDCVRGESLMEAIDKARN